jgi:hypothetical protein|tara:strand:- start:344 stop:631 length:288 start_codon:yes stop_codon:yes gene_type:complete|mmetsp:Transcript_18376/g.47931  ORF Transcript_18376/g.47931 Transcript_18376/m.47931 type:complete len:96 (+) Transcript_18376:1080-1367(+)
MPPCRFNLIIGIISHKVARAHEHLLEESLCYRELAQLEETDAALQRQACSSSAIDLLTNPNPERLPCRGDDWRPRRCLCALLQAAADCEDPPALD